MRCPGQDWRYWQGAVTLEAPCPACGQAVEFFKDEPARRCRHCGHRLTNPRLCLDCAAWCEHAAECLGVGFQGAATAAAESRVAACLIQFLETHFAGQPQRLVRALLIFQHAKELAAAAGFDGRVILPASLLAELYRSGPGSTSDAASSSPAQAEALAARTRQLLCRCGLDEQTIELVWHCLVYAAPQQWQLHESKAVDVAAVRALLADACTLAEVSLARRDMPPSAGRPATDREQQLLSRLVTDAARQYAHRLFGFSID